MRDLPAFVAAAVAANTTQPTYLVELQLDTLLRLSTRGDIQDQDGVLWSASGVRVTFPSESTARIELLNTDGALTPYLVGAGWRGNAVRVWQCWTDDERIYDADVFEPDVYAEAAGLIYKLALFEGSLDAASEVFPTATLTASRDGVSAVPMPPMRIDATWMHRLVAPGTVVSWNGDTYVLLPAT